SEDFAGALGWGTCAIRIARAGIMGHIAFCPSLIAPVGRVCALHPVTQIPSAIDPGALFCGRLGRSQVVRQRILIPPYGGSNPPAPAKQNQLIIVVSCLIDCNYLPRLGASGEALGGHQLFPSPLSRPSLSRRAMYAGDGSPSVSNGSKV